MMFYQDDVNNIPDVTLISEDQYYYGFKSYAATVFQIFIVAIPQ